MSKFTARGEGSGGEVRQVITVPSASRPGRVHYVSPDLDACSCEGFHFTGHCRHVEMLRPRYCPDCLGSGTFVSYPKLCECATCSGTGFVGEAV